MATPTTRRTTTNRRTAQNTPPVSLTWQQKIRAFWREYKRTGWTRFLTLFVATYMVLLSSLCVNFLKANNYIEIYPHELIFPTLMHGLSALLITLVLFWLPWLKSFASKMLASIMLALNVIGYDSDLEAASGVIKAFMPGVTNTDPMVLASLVYAILLLALSVGVGLAYELARTKVKRLQPANMQLGLAVLVIWLFAVPASSVVQILPVLIRESDVAVPTFVKPQTPYTETEKPDIYYFVFDRYTNNTVMKSQFDFDNSGLTNYLRQNNFTVNDNAYANYPYTAFSVASTLNASYLNKAVEPFKNQNVQSRTLFHTYSRQSSVVKALKDIGYKYSVVGSWYGTSNAAPLADRDYMHESLLTVFDTQFDLHGIEANEFKQSPYYRFAKAPELAWWPFKLSEPTAAQSVIDQFNRLETLTTKDKPGGRFIFAHILLPHEPHSFNADGSFALTTEADNSGKPVKQKYTGSVEFANSQITKIVEQIKKQSGDNAVIIFNADEGPYPEYFTSTIFKYGGAIATEETGAPVSGNTNSWPQDWFNIKYGILQAVHIPRATADDLSNLSSANIFRIVLNRYAGYNLSYLPECHFGLPETSLKSYVLDDVTARFKTNPDPACQDYQSLR